MTLSASRGEEARYRIFKFHLYPRKNNRVTTKIYAECNEFYLFRIQHNYICPLLSPKNTIETGSIAWF